MEIREKRLSIKKRDTFSKIGSRKRDICSKPLCDFIVVHICKFNLEKETLFAIYHNEYAKN